MSDFQTETEISPEVVVESPVKNFMRSLIKIDAQDFSGLEEWEKDIKVKQSVEADLTRFNQWFKDAAPFYLGQKGLTDKEVKRVTFTKSKGVVIARHEATKITAEGANEGEARSALKKDLVGLLAKLNIGDKLMEETTHTELYKDELTSETMRSFGLIE